MTRLFEPALLPFLLLLAILPYPGTVALRLLCLAVAFAYAVYAWKRLAVPAFPVKPVLVLWALVALASLFYAVDPAYSLSEIKNELMYTMMAFMAFFVISSDERRLKWMLLALSAGAFVLCFWALSARLSLGFWDDSGGYGGTGSFATYLVAVVPVVSLLGFYFRDNRLRNLSLVLLTLLLVTGFFCLQRVIWPVLLLQSVIALVLYKKVFGLNRMRVAGIVALLAVAAVTSLVFTQSAKTTIRDYSESSMEIKNDVRFSFWPRVVGRIMEEPAIGAGFGRSAMSKAHRDLIPRESPYLWHAHNVVLNYGLAMGVPGMVALLLVFAALLWEYIRFWRSVDRELGMLGACGIVLVIGILARNMLNDFFMRDAAILFWALNGMLLGLGRRKMAKSHGEPA